MMSIDITPEQVEQVINWASGAAESIKAEGVIIAEQILQSRVMELSVDLVISCVWLLFWSFLAGWTFKIIFKAYCNQNDNGEWGWSDRFKNCTYNTDGLNYGIIWSTLAVSSLGLVMVLGIDVIPNIMALIKVNVAPKLYLLEYFKELAG